ncbi:MAG: M14 family zinc carboxypeptidase [Bacteroidota bacterium]
MRFASTAVLALLLAAPAALHAQQAADAPPRYSEVRITLADRSDLADLSARVPGVGHVGLDKVDGRWVAVTVLSEADLADLAASGFAYEVSVADLAADYAARAPFSEAERQQALAASRASGFGFGSMGGYYTFDEVVAKLDEMHADYPDLITARESIGQSHQGRDIWMVKISDNPGVDENEPEVLYTALHHAREPQSMATVIYYMFYLLENYGTNTQATNLVNNREMYFVPVLNPDGYVYNQQTNPDGGGFWRKNRRDNPGSSFGVDLNRNYAYEWGRDNQGSSGNASSEVYRGPAPFSEPETAAIRDFLNTREIRGAFNYHSYSNVLLHSWGYERGVYTPDQDLFTRASTYLTQVNGYEFGQAADVLYPANGDSDDWHYGEQDTKGKIFAWTPEVGSFFQGFWPRQSDIVPLAETNRVMNLRLARLAGFYPTVARFEVAETHSGNGHLDPGESAAATVTVQNIGLEGMTGVRLRIVSEAPGVLDEPSRFSQAFDLAAGESVEVEGLAFTLSPSAPLGLRSDLAVEFSFDDVALAETLTGVAIGTPVALFEDPAASTGGWTTGDGWGLTPTQGTSTPTAFADSPSGFYRDGANNALTLAEPLDLSSAASPRLRFMARWDIEAGYDVAQVRASTDGGTWTPLAGRYTSVGSGNGAQVPGEPGYDGTQATWVEESIDLSAFEGAPEVQVQFVLRADGGVTADGFYVDDLAVEYFTNANPVSTEGDGAQPDQVVLFENYPNPFDRQTLIPFELPQASTVSLAVYDLLGQRVRTLADGLYAAGSHSATWDGSDGAGQAVASGVYVVTLRAAGSVKTRKLLVVR